MSSRIHTSARLTKPHHITSLQEDASPAAIVTPRRKGADAAELKALKATAEQRRKERSRARLSSAPSTKFDADEARKHAEVDSMIRAKAALGVARRFAEGAPDDAAVQETLARVEAAEEKARVAGREGRTEDVEAAAGEVEQMVLQMDGIADKVVRLNGALAWDEGDIDMTSEGESLGSESLGSDLDVANSEEDEYHDDEEDRDSLIVSDDEEEGEEEGEEAEESEVDEEDADQEGEGEEIEVRASGHATLPPFAIHPWPHVGQTLPVDTISPVARRIRLCHRSWCRCSRRTMWERSSSSRFNSYSIGSIVAMKTESTTLLELSLPTRWDSARPSSLSP